MQLFIKKTDFMQTKPIKLKEYEHYLNCNAGTYFWVSPKIFTVTKFNLTPFNPYYDRHLWTDTTKLSLRQIFNYIMDHNYVKIYAKQDELTYDKRNSLITGHFCKYHYLHHSTCVCTFFIDNNYLFSLIINWFMFYISTQACNIFVVTTTVTLHFIVKFWGISDLESVTF